MSKITTLHDTHKSLGARLVNFGGWEMPLHYGSQIDEHHEVRRRSGMFDVSHMGIVDIQGPGAGAYLQQLLANDIGKLDHPGRALYSCMLRADGGIIDDLVAFFLEQDSYRLVINAATTDQDLAWMHQQATGFAVDIRVRHDLDMIAVQGPNARAAVRSLLSSEEAESVMQIPVFDSLRVGDLFIARTGYTGEDGFEVILPKAETTRFWFSLYNVGVLPCGLGARDTLRLEAGMNLYGTDMDETVSPLDCGLGWTVSWQPEGRNFIGRQALQQQTSVTGLQRFCGLLLQGKGILRHGQAVYQLDRQVGTITSGGYSPTLEASIAMARISADTAEPLLVDIRGKQIPVRLVKLPFVRRGRSLIDL